MIGGVQTERCYWPPPHTAPPGSLQHFVPTSGPSMVPKRGFLPELTRKNRTKDMAGAPWRAAGTCRKRRAF